MMTISEDIRKAAAWVCHDDYFPDAEDLALMSRLEALAAAFDQAREGWLRISTNGERFAVGDREYLGEQPCLVVPIPEKNP